MKKSAIGARIIKDRLFTGIIFAFSAALIIPLIMILSHIIQKGASSITPAFLTHLPTPVGEAGGGIYNAIIGTLYLVGLASLLSVPIGMATGIYMSENKNSKLSYFVRICVEVLQGTPSIVVGIITYLWVVKPMGHFSVLAGGIALGIMMLPVIIRSTEETLNLIPHSLKEASLALGVPYYRTILKVIVPSAFSGILTGILLGVARVAGETAPLLFTAFGNPFINYNILKPMASLPLMIFTYATSPYEEWHNYAWGASLVLIGFILALSLITKGVTRR